jgi:sec-independent protein translocase protein TatC
MAFSLRKSAAAIGLPPIDRPPESRETDDFEEPGGAKMSFLDHLDELRKRLMVSVAALGVGFLIGLAFIGKIFDFIMKPLQQALPQGSKLMYIAPTEAFMLQLKIAAIVGLFIAIPVILWQLWLFVAPGLYAKEKRFAIPFVLFSTVFFVMGAAFSHYIVFPWAWVFLSSFTTDYMVFQPTIASTFSLYSQMLLAMGVVFEMPTLVLFLARMGVVSAGFLLRHFKYAVLIIFIVAAVITPTGDMVTQSLMAGPMIGLYLFSIVVAWIFGKKRKPKPTDALASIDDDQ